MGGRTEGIQAVPQKQQHVALIDDIEDDPHRAGLELNPDVAEKITFATCSGLTSVFLCLPSIPPHVLKTNNNADRHGPQ